MQDNDIQSEKFKDSGKKTCEMYNSFRTRAKTPVNDVAKFGIDVSNKTVTRVLSMNEL